MKKWLTVYILMLAMVVFAGCSLPIQKTAAEGSDLDLENTGQKQLASGDTAIGMQEKEQDPSVGQILITLYYQDKDGLVVPVTRRTGKQDGIARAALNGLIDTAASREEIEYFGLYPVLPEGTVIRGLTIKDGLATVDFSKQFLNYQSEQAEKTILTSVVYTLTQFPTVQDVMILIEGENKKQLKYTADVSEKLNRSRFMINTEKLWVAKNAQKTDIFLYKPYNDEFNYIIPVSIEHAVVKESELPAAMVQWLCKDYSESKYNTQMPEKTKLLDNQKEENELTLNFNAHFLEYGGTRRETGMLDQLVYTFGQLQGIDKIKIQIDGADRELPEGTDISQGLKVPRAINDYIDR